MLCSCSYDLDCVTQDDIAERWFEISSPLIQFDHCYLLTNDGLVLEKDGNSMWQEGTWHVIDHCDDCLFEIGAGNKSIVILEESTTCITVKYEGAEAEICDCSY